MISERQHIQDILYDWVVAVIKENGREDQVVWRNGEGPRPVPPFISIEFVGSRTPGQPNYSKVRVKQNEDGTPDTSDDGRRTIKQYVRRTLTMYGFGEGAIDLLETVKASIWFSEHIYFLKRNGLVINDATEVKELPQELSSDVENGAFFEFVLTYRRVLEDAPGWIGQVDIESDTPIGDFNVTTMEEG